MEEVADFAVATQFLNRIAHSAIIERSKDTAVNRQAAHDPNHESSIAVSSTSTYDDIHAKDNASIQNGDIIAQTITNNYFYGTICLHDASIDSHLVQAEAALRHFCAERNERTATVSTQRDPTDTTPSLRAHREPLRDRAPLSWHLAEIFYITSKRWIQDPIQEYFTFMSDLDTFATTKTWSRASSGMDITALHRAARAATAACTYFRPCIHAPLEETSYADNALECPEPMARHQAGGSRRLSLPVGNFSRRDMAVLRWLASSIKSDTWAGFSMKGIYTERTSLKTISSVQSHTETRTTVFKLGVETARAAQARSGRVEEIDEHEENV